MKAVKFHTDLIVIKIAEENILKNWIHRGNIMSNTKKSEVKDKSHVRLRLLVNQFQTTKFQSLELLIE